jgi:DNA polymerase kappa
MDMFYAAVEIRDNPTSLRDKPVVVFDNQMIVSANYIARDFGVNSGMPLFIGKKLCPNLNYIKANYPNYKAVSQEFKDILAIYDPDLESMGLDEATIDATNYLRYNSIDNVEGRIYLGQKIRQEIFERTSLTASCGIACNKLLSKICSGTKKPNGMTYLDFNETEILSFMKDMPINRL